MTSVSLPDRIKAAQKNNAIPSIGVLLATREKGIISSYNTAANNLVLKEKNYISHYPKPPNDIPNNDPNHILYDMGSQSPLLILTALEILNAKQLFDWNDPITNYIPGFKSSFYENVTTMQLIDHTSCLSDQALNNFQLTDLQKEQVHNMQAYCYIDACRRGDQIRIGLQGQGATVLNSTLSGNQRYVQWHMYPPIPDSKVYVDSIIVNENGTTCLTNIILCEQNVAATVYSWSPPIASNCKIGTDRKYSDKILMTLLKYILDTISAKDGYNLKADPEEQHAYHRDVYVEMINDVIFRPLSMTSSFLIQQEDGKWIATLEDVYKFASWFSYGLIGSLDPNAFNQIVMPLPMPLPFHQKRIEQFEFILDLFQKMHTCDADDLDKWCYTTACDANFLKFDATGKIIIGSGIPYNLLTSYVICTNGKDKKMWKEYTTMLELDLWMDHRYFEIDRWVTPTPSSAINKKNGNGNENENNGNGNANNNENNGNDNANNPDYPKNVDANIVGSTPSSFLIETKMTNESGIAPVVVVLCVVVLVCGFMVWFTGKWRNGGSMTYSEFDRSGRSGVRGGYTDRDEEDGDEEDEDEENGRLSPVKDVEEEEDQEKDQEDVVIRMEQVEVELVEMKSSPRTLRSNKKKPKNKKSRIRRLSK